MQSLQLQFPYKEQVLVFSESVQNTIVSSPDAKKKLRQYRRQNVDELYRLTTDPVRRLFR
jgi:hypothetical protein